MVDVYSTGYFVTVVELSSQLSENSETNNSGPEFMSVTALLAMLATASVSLANVSVSIMPGPVGLSAGQSTQFTAKVVGTTNTAVKWSMKPNVGSLVNGLYTAPAKIVAPEKVTLTATSVADSTKSAAVSLVVSPIKHRVLL